MPHISTGDLLRAEVAAGTPLGLEAKDVMARGDLVSDAILLGMLEDRFSRPDTAQRLHPRRLPAQPRAGRGAGRRCWSASASRWTTRCSSTCRHELLVERIAGRAKAEGRADDKPESVRTRLQIYDDQTAPVVDYYRQHGQLTVVDGVGTLDEVFNRILEAIAPVRKSAESRARATHAVVRWTSARRKRRPASR